MSDVIWEDPPEPPEMVGRTPWERRLLPLKERPEKWARVASYEHRATAQTVVRSLETARLRVPTGRWEFTFGANGNSDFHVYARFLGESE